MHRLNKSNPCVVQHVLHELQGQEFIDTKRETWPELTATLNILRGADLSRPQGQ